MGVCCCKSENIESKSKQESKSNEEKPNEQKSEDHPLDKSNQQSTQSSIEMHVTNSNNQSDNDAKQTVNNDINDENDIKSSTHWKTKTMQLLTAISADNMVDLGSDFEDYDDKQYHESRQLINKPRKSYITRYIQKDEIDKFNLKIGTTLNKSSENNDEKCVWTPGNASNFKLRSIAYATSKRGKNALKPSKNALYDIIGMDCFEIDDQDAVNINLHTMIETLNIDSTLKHMNRDRINMDITYPQLIVVSLMLPLFKKKERNGLHLLLYTQMSNEFENSLKNNDPSIGLLDKLINLDQFAIDNFKMDASIPNINKTTLNSITKKLVKNINGKCMPIKKHATFEYLKNEKKNVFIIKFNGFGLNKQIIKGLSTVRDHLYTMDFEIGFHIGAKVKDILPERMLICAKINKLDVKQFMKFDAFCAKKEEEYEKQSRGHSRVETYVMDDVED
eukprot:26665_1